MFILGRRDCCLLERGGGVEGVEVSPFTTVRAWKEGDGEREEAMVKERFFVPSSNHQDFHGDGSIVVQQLVRGEYIECLG